MPDDRRYDEREVGLILKRLAELQLTENARADARSMSRAEIEEVAADLGIDRRLVQRAVAEVALHERVGQTSWWLGGKTAIMFEESLGGAIDDDSVTRMIEVLRRNLGDPGTLDVSGTTRIWMSTDKAPRRVHFSVVAHGNQTTLRLEERLADAGNMTVSLAALGGFFAGVMILIPLKALVAKGALLLAIGPILAGGSFLGWLTGRVVWKRFGRRYASDIGRMFSKILETRDPPTTARGPDSPPLRAHRALEPAPLADEPTGER